MSGFPTFQNLAFWLSYGFLKVLAAAILIRQHLHLPDTARQGLCGAHLPRAQVPGSAGEVNMPQAEPIFPFVYLVPFVVRLFPINCGTA